MEVVRPVIVSNGVTYLQMRSVRSYSKSWRAKGGKWKGVSDKCEDFIVQNCETYNKNSIAIILHSLIWISFLVLLRNVLRIVPQI